MTQTGTLSDTLHFRGSSEYTERITRISRLRVTVSKTGHVRGPSCGKLSPIFRCISDSVKIAVR